MWHTFELAAILLLLAIGQAVIDVSPHPLRRFLTNYIIWCAAFTAGILIVSWRVSALYATEIGIVLLACYMIRWFMSSAVEHFRGPMLFEPPRRGELAELAHRMTGKPLEVCSDAAKEVLRKHHSRLALLGIMNMPDAGSVDDLVVAWQESTSRAASMSAEISDHNGGSGVADILFVAQMLSVYDESSVLRAMKTPNSLGSRARRKNTLSQLQKAGKVRRAAVDFGLPLADVAAAKGRTAMHIAFVHYLFPPAALGATGFHVRAFALGLSEALLATYGIVSIVMGSASGWVYLAVAVLLHALAMFAVPDFHWLAIHSEALRKQVGDT